MTPLAAVKKLVWTQLLFNFDFFIVLFYFNTGENW